MSLGKEFGMFSVWKKATKGDLVSGKVNCGRDSVHRIFPVLYIPATLEVKLGPCDSSDNRQ